MCAWRVIDPSAVAQIELFKGLSDEERGAIALLASIESFKKNDLIVAEGSRGDRLFFILDGSVRVSRTIPGVGEEALAILPRGAFFGEMALFGDPTRSADVFADARCRMLVIYLSDLDALMQQQPALATRFLWSCSRTLADRLRAANAKVAFLSAAGRFE